MLHFRRRFFLSSLSDVDDDDEDDDESELDDDDDDDELESTGAATICLGAFLRCARRPSVSRPRPIDVKKLMAKRVLRGLSRGNRPANDSCIDASSSRCFSLARPRYLPIACGTNVPITDKTITHSASSLKRILMKIRDDDVVSSSLSRMWYITVHSSASECSKCANNFDTLRS
jgi:hypothetical protein